MKRKFLFSAWLFVLAVLMAVGTVAPASAIGQTNGCQVVQCDNDDKPCPVLRIYLQPPDETPVVFKDVFVPSPLDKIYVGVGGVVSASMFGLPKDNNWAFAVMLDVNMVFRLGESNWGIMIDGQVGGGNAPGKAKVGIMPGHIHKVGHVGVVSKSGTLTYQMMYELRDLGFSTAIGIGGDPVIGTTHIDALAAFEADPETKAIVMIGEIGGDAEERAADFIKANVTKPVVGYVAGFTAPEGKTMGHAGAIVSGSAGTAQAKKEALEAAGVKVGKTPSETAALMRELIQGL